MEQEKLIKEMEQKIGYQFKNQKLLLKALTHSSFINENNMKKGEDNERLEFLGDAVLEIITSEFLYHKYPTKPEGELTKMRSSMVCEPTLALCAREMDLGKYLLLGKGENATGGRQRESITSDALEAIIGALYLDGGFAIAKEFVNAYVLNDLENKKLFYDSTTILQEIVQREFEELLNYQLVGEEGPDHNKIFTVNARIGERVVGEGTGRTKKSAEQNAAYEGILTLQKEDIFYEK